MTEVFRVFVKKNEDPAARGLQNDLKTVMGIPTDDLEIIHRFDVMGITAEELDRALPIVFSEPATDNVWLEQLPAPWDSLPLNDMRSPVPDVPLHVVGYEALPGQFDQRADSAAQCLEILLGCARPIVRYATLLLLRGCADVRSVAKYVVNPVECALCGADKPATLERETLAPPPVETCTGFRDQTDLGAWVRELGLAMDEADAAHLQAYFRREDRDPTMTEVRVLDTYWSDHCRHTTFMTEITNIDSNDTRVNDAYALYLKTKTPGKPVTLMSIATAAMKHLRDAGKLPNLDESEEINACTIKVRAETENGAEDWLLLFKNETHNHPTEIEPFGGAATCIGGAIRDPLSGRAYVYGAMRVTGAADPRVPFSETIPGKIPQRKLTQTAAAGYSSYGNQIGLATGLVREVYHPGYAAKRMEIGAVIAAVPAASVRRETPAPGDVVLLLGGKTGRDGIGGATGSSKTHTQTSTETCFSEVQKGNAPEERKLQRLFRNPGVSLAIKRCNDFGAGGVSVAIGELADGLLIDLDAVPKKYDGLGGTDLAISESQERMAIVVAPGDVAAVAEAAAGENVLCTQVAVVTAEKRLKMQWNGATIVDLDRAFLDTAGAGKTTEVLIDNQDEDASSFFLQKKEDKRLVAKKTNVADDCQLQDSASRILALVSDINFCSQRGLHELFDGTVGAGSVFVPYGGANLSAPAEVLAMRLPGTKTISVMSHGYDISLAHDPFQSGYTSVVQSLAKLAATGVAPDDMSLTLQEYFPKPTNPAKWGLVTAGLLGAFQAQMDLGIAAIGGKDSMSGTFTMNNQDKAASSFVADNGQLTLEVPPTLVAFGVGTTDHVVPSHFLAAGEIITLVTPNGDMRDTWKTVAAAAKNGTILSAQATTQGGAMGAVCRMTLGGVGAALARDSATLWDVPAGSIVCTSAEALPFGVDIGRTSADGKLTVGNTFIPLDSLHAAYEAPLESVFPTKLEDSTPVPRLFHPTAAPVRPPVILGRKPRAVIPVFPGTNGEFDMQRAFELAGGEAVPVLVRNEKPAWLRESIGAMSAAIADAEMILFPGGFSGGDEPLGAGKFMVSFFMNAQIAESVHQLLKQRNGLILGICNGFQALIKLGLLPYGEIRTPAEHAPTLTFNRIGRHQARLVRTRIASNRSPWLADCAVGEVFTLPISHGEGRFFAHEEVLRDLIEEGQIATQYCDVTGCPSMSAAVNPPGSLYAVEAITSPCGCVLGKMAHTERSLPGTGLNVSGLGNTHQPLFEAGVRAFG